MTASSAPSTTNHERRVRLQRQVHETRRMLLEAADYLLDVDLAIRADDAQRREVAHQQALSMTAAAQREMERLHDRVIVLDE